MRFVRCLLLTSCFIMSGCMRNSSETWEDLKTAGRYMGRGVDALWGKDYESKMVASDDEFIGPYDDEFIPLRDSDLKGANIYSDAALPQPKGIPGQKGVPPLTDFLTSSDSLFHPVHFETDEHVIKDKQELQSLMALAAYLKKNPNLYLLIEGHTDERASASYNVALGMRRANYVRSFLVKQGADLNRIYTISKGKEHPLTAGHSPNDWKVNRRSEFKMYQK